jgi:hypothetical protein
LTDLRATNFADDLSRAEAGLEEPNATVNVTSGGQTHELMIGVVESSADSGSTGSDGKAGGDAETSYYAKLPGERFIYQLETYAGNKLDVRLGEIRSKTPRSIPSSEVTEMAFPGDDGVVVGRDGADWVLVQPSADKEFNAKKFEAHRQAALGLTVAGFPDVEAGEVGLERGSEDVRIERKKQPTLRLLIGERADEGGRYVRFSDRQEVFRISNSTYDKLTVAVEDVTGEIQKQKGRGAMPKGMGGPPGGGGKLNPAQKRKIMQQLKQKMGNR